jgi:hypothetical protein
LPGWVVAVTALLAAEAFAAASRALTVKLQDVAGVSPVTVALVSATLVARVDPV